MNALERLSQAANEWGIPLDQTALGRIETYLKAVKEKNAITNLTADDSWDDLVLKHAADGVFAASILKTYLGPKPRILDLGSGGGFIGICLKISWPDAEVSLMEAVERKYKFLNSAVTAFQTEEIDPQEPALSRTLAATGAKVLQSHAYRRPGEDRDRRLAIFARTEA